MVEMAFLPDTEARRDLTIATGDMLGQMMASSRCIYFFEEHSQRKDKRE